MLGFRVYRVWGLGVRVSGFGVLGELELSPVSVANLGGLVQLLRAT